MTGIDEVHDLYMRLAAVLAMESTGVLLQGALPRDRHRQHQRVERRMFESLAYQLTGSHEVPPQVGPKLPVDQVF